MGQLSPCSFNIPFSIQRTYQSLRRSRQQNQRLQLPSGSLFTLMRRASAYRLFQSLARLTQVDLQLRCFALHPVCHIAILTNASSVLCRGTANRPARVVDRTHVVSAQLARPAPNGENRFMCQRQLEGLEVRWRQTHKTSGTAGSNRARGNHPWPYLLHTLIRSSASEE